MSSIYADDTKLFVQLADANNKRDQVLYSAIRECFSDAYVQRIPAIILPWDNLLPEELKELADMFVDRTIIVETGDRQQPKQEQRIVAKNFRALLTSSFWRKRLNG